MVEPERVRVLNDEAEKPGGRYVLYWMQASQREPFNPALELPFHRGSRTDPHHHGRLDSSRSARLLGVP